MKLVAYKAIFIIISIAFINIFSIFFQKMPSEHLFYSTVNKDNMKTKVHASENMKH